MRSSFVVQSKVSNTGDCAIPSAYFPSGVRSIGPRRVGSCTSFWKTSSSVGRMNLLTRENSGPRMGMFGVIEMRVGSARKFSLKLAWSYMFGNSTLNVGGDTV